MGVKEPGAEYINKVLAKVSRRFDQVGGGTPDTSPSSWVVRLLQMFDAARGEPIPDLRDLDAGALGGEASAEMVRKKLEQLGNWVGGDIREMPPQDILKEVAVKLFKKVLHYHEKGGRNDVNAGRSGSESRGWSRRSTDGSWT